MPIIQINIFVCEKCGKVSKTFDDDILMYSDPVVTTPNDEYWDYSDDDKLLCEKCCDE